MGITRLKRKARRNKQTAAKRQNSMKQLNAKPVIKNVDQEEMKASFGTSAPAEPVVDEVVETPAAVVEEVVEEAPAAEVVEEAPVAEPAEEVAEVEAPVAEATEEAAAEASEEVTAEAEEAPDAEEDTEEDK